MNKDRRCAGCSDRAKKLLGNEILYRVMALPGWKDYDEHHISKEFIFPDFKTALDFVNKVGILAEEESHHPDIYLSWGKVVITLFTHKVEGLTEDDFILAEQIESLISEK